MKKGDTVMLKSGGPLMTIYSDGTDNVGCTWFNFDKGFFSQALFNKELLCCEDEIPQRKQQLYEINK